MMLVEALGQQIVVDNRAGAGGVVGMEIGKNANPDGYTLITTSLAAHPQEVENRPGESGAVGTRSVARAAPDGYKLLAANPGPLTVGPAGREYFGSRGYEIPGGTPEEFGAFIGAEREKWDGVARRVGIRGW